ncbi:MAG: pyrroline-5-carboxylate reductase [Oscillospiraceae bacterium]|nr:pyrroline-5-carboxylate reductase [Oscillospiraceae bacterium]
MKYGFIGCGNMGGALAKAVCRAAGGENIILSGGSSDRAKNLAAELGAKFATNAEAAKECDMLFIGVKPYLVGKVIEPIAKDLAERKVCIVSMAAGVSISELESMAPGCPIIRIMPNTPVASGCGVVLWCANDSGSEYEKALCYALSQSGLVDKLEEKLFDAGTALSGCGPAFVYMFIEALADGAVACGLPRQKVMLYALSTLQGAAEHAALTKEHPGALKDAVCSPGGSTIAGVRALETKGFRSAAAEAVCAAFEKIKG